MSLPRPSHFLTPERAPVAPHGRARPSENVRRPCGLARALSEPEADSHSQDGGRLRALAGWGAGAMAAAFALHMAWVAVVRPIDAAADALANMATVVAPPDPGTPEVRADRAKRRYGEATSALAREPAGSRNPAVEAQAQRRLVEWKAARELAGR